MLLPATPAASHPGLQRISTCQAVGHEAQALVNHLMKGATVSPEVLRLQGWPRQALQSSHKNRLYEGPPLKESCTARGLPLDFIWTRQAAAVALRAPGAWAPKPGPLGNGARPTLSHLRGHGWCRPDARAGASGEGSGGGFTREGRREEGLGRGGKSLCAGLLSPRANPWSDNQLCK